MNRTLNQPVCLTGDVQDDPAFPAWAGVAMLWIWVFSVCFKEIFFLVSAKVG